MEEIDIQNKLADWQKRMDARREAEVEQKRIETEKQRQQHMQRTRRTGIKP